MVMNTKKRFIVGFIVSLLIIIYVFKHIDLAQFMHALQDINLTMIFPFFVSTVAFFVLKGMRWKLLLKPVKKCSLKEVIPSMMIGSSVNYISFVYLGEILRTWALSHTTKLSKTSIGATIVLERIFDALTVLCLAAIGFSLTQSIPSSFVKAGYALSFGSAFAMGIFIFLVFFTTHSEKIFRACLCFIPSSFLHIALKHFHRAILGLHSIKSLTLLWQVLALSFVQWFFMALSVFIAFLAAGLTLPFYASFITVAIIVFGMAVPSSPGHLGVIELCFILSLKMFSIEDERALTAALFYHVFLYTPVILSGIWYLYRYNFKIKDFSF